MHARPACRSCDEVASGDKCGSQAVAPVGRAQQLQAIVVHKDARAAALRAICRAGTLQRGNAGLDDRLEALQVDRHLHRHARQPPAPPAGWSSQIRRQRRSQLWRQPCIVVGTAAGQATCVVYNTLPYSCPSRCSSLWHAKLPVVRWQEPA